MQETEQRVELELPLSTRHASLVRLVAVSLAADAGFDVDQIDDLQLGVSEAVAFVADAPAGPEGRLRVAFLVDGSTVEVGLSRTSQPVADATGLDELARRILGVVVDSFGVEHGAFVLRKAAVPAPA